MTSKEKFGGIFNLLVFSSVFIFLGIVFGGLNRIMVSSVWIFWAHQILVGGHGR